MSTRPESEHSPLTPTSIESVTEMMLGQNYLADNGLSTAIYLSLKLPQALLLEGSAGVGKTEVAKSLSGALGVDLIRLQCYEGIDANQALYEWDYSRQLLHLRLAQSAESIAHEDLFSEKFLVERPLLQAIRRGPECVLLIDEIDRADDEFEAFLLEILSDFQISIPEVGTVEASIPPPVIITSNRTRELHDALKRRCLYHWIDYPTLDREIEIVMARAPEVPEDVSRSVSSVVARIREFDLVKQPGVAETINWARALRILGEHQVNRDNLEITLGLAIKDRDDMQTIMANTGYLLDGI